MRSCASATSRTSTVLYIMSRWEKPFIMSQIMDCQAYWMLCLAHSTGPTTLHGMMPKQSNAPPDS